jgi:hypothetical protein
MQQACAKTDLYSEYIPIVFLDLLLPIYLYHVETNIFAPPVDPRLLCALPQLYSPR